MGKELVVRQQLTPAVWQMISQVAPAMHAARFFGVSNPEQAMAIMLKGYELGLPLAASFEFIQVVEKRPVLSPRGMLGIIQRHPEYEKITITDNVDDKGDPESCTVYMKRQNGFEHTVTFSMKDAERAGLIKPKGAWTTYPANMLRWRAVGFCADVVFSDVTGGLKRADEMGADISPEGDVVEGEWADVLSEDAHSQQAIESGSSVTSLDDLIEKYGADAIMAVNESKIPSTDEEVAAVEAKLADAPQSETF